MTRPNRTYCTARTKSGDTRDHVCRRNTGHDGDHECICGYHWPIRDLNPAEAPK